MEKIKKFFIDREWLTVSCLVVIFILIRLPGTSLPLHQDEYKWPLITNPETAEGRFVPHPPLGEFIYRTAGSIVGFNTNFRFVPLFFGTLNLLLLYYLMKFLFGRREALIASVIWIFSYFSVLASLMVDTDGQFLPFFFLLALIAYFKSRQTQEKEKYAWLTLLILVSILGVFVKLSFILTIGAIATDFLWSKKDILRYQPNRIFLAGIVPFIIFIGGIFILLVLSQKLFSFFNFEQSLTYWEHFWRADRAWMQVFIQCAKVFLYLSPFLVLIPLLDIKKAVQKTKVFLFFLVFVFVFYILLFDFSAGSLDRYLQNLILPLTVMSSVVLASMSRTVLDIKNWQIKKFACLGCILALGLILFQFLPHYVPPLHPKSEWISRILELKWNFLYPFSGGSGPLGFYVSFLFVSLTWIISLIALVFSIWKPRLQTLCLAVLISLGIAYNGIFIEEYLFGLINGSAPKLIVSVVEYIKYNPDIKMVTVYNDNGGNEIQKIGKYRKRLYIDPKFDINEKVATLNKYKEHYFVLNVPRFDQSSVYQKYFDSCKIIYDEKDKKMEAVVYDCRDAPDVKL